MAIDAAIRVTNLTKLFGVTVALDKVTLDVPKGALYGLIGPNGAGKTTLFSLIAGFLKPTEGEIEVLDINVEEISRLQGRLSILPQDALFQSNVPIIDQLNFFGRLLDYSKEEALERSIRALSIVGLGEQARKNPHALSHGMSKRLGIAQAFLGDPEVVLLDEPTAGLDPGNAHAIRQLIQKLHKEEKTVVVSSHNLKEIQQICTHFAIIDRGVLRQDGRMDNLVRADTIVRMTFARDLRGEEIQAVRSVPGVKSIASEREGEYIIHLDVGKGGEDAPVPVAKRATSSTDSATEPMTPIIGGDDDLEMPTDRESVISAIVKTLLTYGLVPRSVTEGASLESRFLEITSDLEDE